MTDGQQTRGDEAKDAKDLHDASKPLKEQGVQIYSLGIGDDYNIGELLDIASDDASVFRAGDFDELLSIVTSITEQTCKGNFCLFVTRDVGVCSLLILSPLKYKLSGFSFDSLILLLVCHHIPARVICSPNPLDHYSFD